MQNEIVWISDDKTSRHFPAELLNMGAYYSMVKYTRGGNDYEVLVSNDDIIFGENNHDDPEG